MLSIHENSMMIKEAEGGTAMKIKFNNKYFCWGVTAFLTIAAGIVFYYFVFHSANIMAGIQTITGILMPVVVGMAISYLLSPVVNYTEKYFLLPVCEKLKWKESPKRRKTIRAIAILITAFLFSFGIYMLLYMLIRQIVPSVQNIIANFDTYISYVTEWINRILKDNPEKSAYIINLVDKYSAQLEEWVKSLIPDPTILIKKVSLSVIGVLSFLWNFLIGFIISIYVLASKEKFASQAKKAVYAFFEQDTANQVLANVRFTHDTFIGFIGGKIVDSIIIGLICFIGMNFIDPTYAALISVIIGVTNIIPFFGPYLGAIPSVILMFLVDPMHPLNCVYLAVFLILLQQFDGNILGPKILGSSTGLTGFWVIFAITLFGGLFGIIGMIVGVPIFAVIYAAIRAVINIRLVKKGLPIEAYKYMKLAYIDEKGFHDIVAEPKKKEKPGKKKGKKDEVSDTESK